MLGTGAADGWPNPFCRCDSCLWSRKVKRIRTPTSVLIDGRVLIDPGPEAPRQAIRANTDLADVELVLVSHVHSDHFDPRFLLYRSWVSEKPITLVGPTQVIAECEHWLEPNQTTVTLVEVSAGDRLERQGYQVTVLPARHSALGEAVLFLIEDGRKRIIYACDTGPWADGFIDIVAKQQIDLLVLEETFGFRTDLARDQHLDINSFEKCVQELRNMNVIHNGTKIVAAHLSHHNPIDFEERLARIGVDVLDDGTFVQL